MSEVAKHPTTLRPSARREEVFEHLRKSGHDRAVVTTLDGKLVGVVRREDLDSRT